MVLAEAVLKEEKVVLDRKWTAVSCSRRFKLQSFEQLGIVVGIELLVLGVVDYWQEGMGEGQHFWVLGTPGGQVGFPPKP